MHLQVQYKSTGEPLTLFGLCAVDSKEVDDAGGEVQGHLRVLLQQSHAVSVSIAGSRHAPTEQHQRGPGVTMGTEYTSNVTDR